MTNSKNKLTGVLLAALMSVSAVTAPAFMTTNDLTESASIVQTIEANAAGTYNSTNAVNYAKKYWNNYNPNYRNFNSVGGDCANFVSQCLKAGGLKTDGTWNCYSLAWVNCQAQLNYLKSQGYKATDWAKASDLQVGDVVYYYNGSTICHTAICTKVANGQAYVTAHNKNHVDYEWTLGGSKWWGGSNRRVVVHMNGIIPPDPLPIDSTWKSFFNSDKYIQAYALSNSHKIPVYATANLSSPENGRYIYGDSDLLYIYKVGKNKAGKWVAYISYPVTGGRRKAYVPLSTITNTTQLKTTRSATAKITTYKKANNTSFGYIDKGDKLWYAGKSGNYTRVIYPVTNSKNQVTGYKMAFIKTTDYNNKTK